LQEAEVELNKILRLNPSHKSSLELLSELKNHISPQRSESPNKKLSNEEQVLLVDLDDCKRKKEYEVALGQIETALNSSHRSDSCKLILSCMQAEIFILTGRVTEGKALLKKLELTSSTNTRVLCACGAVAFQEGEFLKARSYFDKAFAIDNTYEACLAGIGACLYQEAKYTEALSYFEKALKLCPDSKRALIGFVETCYCLKETKKPESAIYKYLELHPVDLDVISLLAGCLYVQGRLQDAISEAEKVLIFDPSHKKSLEIIRICRDAHAESNSSTYQQT
jgi:tetratricopeptide (TPR) repeat protein